MKYSKIIETNQGFQASVNLELDLNKKEKVSGYIPTEQSVKVLGEFLHSFYYDTDTQSRANVLIGPYGRGKTHLLLVLTALTSMDVYASSEYTPKEAKAMQKKLCSKISSVDKEVGALAKAVVETGIRTLPVVINSNSRDINQSFLVALHNALSAAQLDDLLPKTYFDSAYDVVKKWENEIPEAYDRFCGELKEYKTTAENICMGLQQFNNDVYDLFCEVYPKVAAGMKFSPLMSMDVVKLYMSVVDALCEQTKYSGINIIFDEFSKFLESNLEKSQMYNMKIIQDLAEAASRSGKKQIHFTCITHKDILEYSTSDSFKTVEGRFSKIYFVASSEQSYELISNAIIKKDAYEDFVKDNATGFGNVMSLSSRVNVFRDIDESSFEKKVVFGCFPLAPLTAYSLLKISELVGQNERTLFTFLANNSANTLGEFLNKNHKTLSFITVDFIFDYFEELFRKEVFNAPVHSFWAKADSAIKQLDDPAQIQIVKAVAIINMIKEDAFKAIPSHIKASILMGDEAFDHASQELQRQHIMTQRDSLEYVLLTANGVDVQKSIDNQVETKAIKVDVCQELNDRCDLGYVIPHEHNDKNCLLRCFKKVFIAADTFCKYKNAQQILDEYTYDGVILYIVDPQGDYTEKVKTKVRSFKKFPQVVVCISKEVFHGEAILKKLVAAGQLKEIAAKNNDIHYLEEIEYFEEDLQKQVQSVVNYLYAPSSVNSAFFNVEGELKITRQAALISRVSEICDSVYKATPIVNNEMVNKSLLNTQNLKGRDIVVEWILNHSEDSVIPCMDGFGPEVSIFKSAFKFTGLDKGATANNDGLNKVLAEIKAFVTNCENEKGNFNTLYEKLLGKPYGMRKGIIPLYIAYVLRPYKENVVFYHSGKEVELSAAVLSNLNDSPEKYDLLMEMGTQERENYLDELDLAFADYSDTKTGSANRIYSIMRSMQNWYRALPEYSKRYTDFLESGQKRTVPEYYKILRSDLAKYDLNAREIIFVQWRDALSDDGNLEECAEKIIQFRQDLDKHIQTFKNELSAILVAMFAPGYQGGLPVAVSAWYKKLPETTRQHVFDANTNALLTLAGSKATYNETDFLDQLVESFEAIGIEDWNDTTADQFRNDIEASLRKIVSYRESKSEDRAECKVAISMPGMVVEKNFSTEDISPLATTALNNLSSIFDEYNDALEPDEKIAILAKLIGKVIQ